MSIGRGLPIIIGGAALYILMQSKTVSAKKDGVWYPIIAKYSTIYHIPIALIYAIIHTESNGNPNANESGYWGGKGATQISLPTARSYGFRGTTAELFEPDNNIHYSVAYLSALRSHFHGNLTSIIAGYNAGMNLTPYPYAYVDKVLKYYDFYAPRFNENALANI